LGKSDDETLDEQNNSVINGSWNVIIIINALLARDFIELETSLV
jgi:hypothetical protein